LFVGPGLDVGADHEISADEQTLALSHLEFIVVVGNPNLQMRIVCCDLSAVAYQIEVEHVASHRESPGAAHEQVTEEGEFYSRKMERVLWGVL
jgi:hypothetical protein